MKLFIARRGEPKIGRSKKGSAFSAEPTNQKSREKSLARKVLREKCREKSDARKVYRGKVYREKSVARKVSREKFIARKVFSGLGFTLGVRV